MPNVALARNMFGHQIRDQFDVCGKSLCADNQDRFLFKGLHDSRDQTGRRQGLESEQESSVAESQQGPIATCGNSDTGTRNELL